jgi:hypothetical protein
LRLLAGAATGRRGGYRFARLGAAALARWTGGGYSSCHQARNVLGHLPERDRLLVRRRLRATWALDDHHRSFYQLRVLGNELDRSHPVPPLRCARVWKTG